MKNQFLLSFLAAGVLLAGCSKNEEGNLPVNNDPTPIVLGTSIEASTKAPVVNGTSISAGIAGWENTASETYAAAPLWNTTIATTANATTAQAVT